MYVTGLIFFFINIVVSSFEIVTRELSVIFYICF